MDSKITDLTELTIPEDDDLIEIVDVSDTSMSGEGTNKKIKRSNISTSLETIIAYSIIL